MMSVRTGVTGTPTFVLDGMRIEGDADELEMEIYEALSRRAA